MFDGEPNHTNNTIMSSSKLEMPRHVTAFTDELHDAGERERAVRQSYSSAGVCVRAPVCVCVCACVRVRACEYALVCVCMRARVCVCETLSGVCVSAVPS